MKSQQNRIELMTRPECRKDENDYIKKLEDRHKILEANIESLLEEIHLLKSEEQQVEQLRSEHLDEQNRSEYCLRWLTQSDSAKEVSSDEPSTSDGKSIWRPINFDQP